MLHSIIKHYIGDEDEAKLSLLTVLNSNLLKKLTVMAGEDENGGQNVQVGDNASGRQDLNIPNFIPSTDKEETAVQWEKWLKTFARKVRFFRVTSEQDKIDALHIYGGPEISEIIDTLPNPADADINVPDFIWKTGDPATEYVKCVSKVNVYLTVKVNKDSSRSEFDTMTQGDTPMATYYVDLKKTRKEVLFCR